MFGVRTKRDPEKALKSHGPVRSAREIARPQMWGGDGDRVLRGNNSAASQPIGTKIQHEWIQTSLPTCRTSGQVRRLACDYMSQLLCPRLYNVLGNILILIIILIIIVIVVIIIVLNPCIHDAKIIPFLLSATGDFRRT